MARSRNIKPGFFTNEELVELDFAARLLFIGLWTEADKAGRLEDRPKRLKMSIFPADNVDVDVCLNALAERGFIERYEAGGVRAIQIVNWSKHQNPHHTEKDSVIPASGDCPVAAGTPADNGGLTVKQPSDDGGNPADSLIHRFSDSLIPDSPIQEASAAPASGAAPARKASTAKPKSGGKRSRPDTFPMPDGFGISDAVRAWAEREGHTRHLSAHFEHFVGVALAKGYVYANWDRALMNAIRDNWAKVGQPQAGAAPRPFGREAENERRKAEFLRRMGQQPDLNVIDMEPHRAIG